MNASNRKTAGRAAGFAIAGILAFGLGVWHAWADDFCMKWCNDGLCWKFGADCWESSVTTSVQGEFWSMTGGGLLSDPVFDPVTWTRRDTCAKECQGKTYSRAMANPPAWDISTCGGGEHETETTDWYYCVRELASTARPSSNTVVQAGRPRCLYRAALVHPQLPTSMWHAQPSCATRLSIVAAAE
jgi:hypothetical protein